jgi:8-oxo-dGTP pyrophosphatase MutT (NUDIX family)
MASSKQHKEVRNPIPVVSAIIERQREGLYEVLIQTRWKPTRDPVYSGLTEIPAGWIGPRENVIDALKREVLEETGLHISAVWPEQNPELDHRSHDDVVGFTPFCCNQQLSGGLPWISLVFICQTSDTTPPREQPEETRDPRWIPLSELQHLLHFSTDQFFPLHVGALYKYLDLRSTREQESRPDHGMLAIVR